MVHYGNILNDFMLAVFRKFDSSSELDDYSINIHLT